MPGRGEYPADWRRLSRGKDGRPKAAVGRTPAATGLGGGISRALNGLPDHAAREEAIGGLWAETGQSPRCARIFSITSGCSMNARNKELKEAKRQRGVPSQGTQLWMVVVLSIRSGRIDKTTGQIGVDEVLGKDRRNRLSSLDFARSLTLSRYKI